MTFLAVSKAESKRVDNFLYFAPSSLAHSALNLEAILDKSVKINGVWLHLGEKFANKKIVLISYPCIELSYEEKIEKLCFKDNFKGKK